MCLVKDNITIKKHVLTRVAFKNCAPFIKFITKIDGRTIDVAENLDLIMPIHNLIEYSSNYSDATGTLCFCSKEETINFDADIGNYNNFKSLWLSL